MKKYGTYLLAVTIAVLALFSSVNAQLVDADKARTVAQNWITTIVDYRGNWGDSQKAYVAGVSEFKRGDRTIGFFCAVEPSGFIIVSLLEGLAPIKAYSTISSFDPDLDEGPADLMKFQLERRLDVIEKELGVLSAVKSADLDKLLEINHREAWQRLLEGPIEVNDKFNADDAAGDYIEGTELLSSRWHQLAPYYNLCPAPPPASSCTDPHCTVGCTATAGAQIMRYWSWPPGRDWLNMPDAMEINPTQAEIDAVSELSHTIGVMDGMEYCINFTCASGGPTDYMTIVYQIFSYSTAVTYTERPDHTANAWYTIIQNNISSNCPTHYEILGHAIVCDGWWVLNGPQYHMNYGWQNTDFNAWYFLDDLHQVDPEGGPVHEKMVYNIYPKVSLGSSISGTITDNPSYPHRYIDRDCSAASVHFEAGQLIHFHPRKVMTCTSQFLRFDGTPSQNTRLYTADYGRGVLINDGRIMMYEGAAIQFGLQRPD